MSARFIRISPDSILAGSHGTMHIVAHGVPLSVAGTHGMAAFLANLRRERLTLRGQVQGVGFRPHVFRMARSLGLAGFVANDSDGAVIEIEGPEDAIDAFIDSLRGNLPPMASVSRLERQAVSPLGATEFGIQASRTGEKRRADATPDAAVCGDCLREMFNPADRRYRYPFVNCTNCGPRYSIMRGIPYDRPATSMSVFPMCEACRIEYTTPDNRRFHAQPIACPVCGPRLRLLDAGGREQSGDPIESASRLLREGQIVAIKGIGGFHLACDAMNEKAVARLRVGKHRDGKPFAVMVADVAVARRLASLSEADERALRSTAAPIVLARKRAEAALAANVAPRCADFGLLLPYTPLHHLLFSDDLGPQVMTSANHSGEPLTYRDDEALRDLPEVADAVLTHDREILHSIDDSVGFTFRDQFVPIRRARGFAPRPIHFWDCDAGDEALLAVGADLKNAVCLLSEGRAIVCEHLGDLSSPASYRHFTQSIARLCDLFGIEPCIIAHDLHPQYLTTQYAKSLGIECVAVQHHHAHIASVMADCGECGPVIGVACDGTGYGVDCAVWGCEILRCERGDCERVGNLAYYPQIGGDLAAIETWRPAVALLREVFGASWLEELRHQAPAIATRFESHIAAPEQIEQQIRHKLNAPPTSSLGRVFDAAAFLLGLCGRNQHEAEAAMALEAAACAAPYDVSPGPYQISTNDGRVEFSLAPLFAELVNKLGKIHDIAVLASMFHATLAHMLADAAQRAGEIHNVRTVALSGGCFVNRILLSRVTELLEARRFRVLIPRHTPLGDGGIALGQAYVAMWRRREFKHNVEGA